MERNTNTELDMMLMREGWTPAGEAHLRKRLDEDRAAMAYLRHSIAASVRRAANLLLTFAARVDVDRAERAV